MRRGGFIVSAIDLPIKEILNTTIILRDKYKNGGSIIGSIRSDKFITVTFSNHKIIKYKFKKYEPIKLYRYEILT